MAVYGSYETVAELGRAGSVSTSRARPADGGWELGFDDLGSDATFVVKAWAVRAAEDAGREEIRRFLERVRAQKRVAEADTKHWAGIVEAGTTPRGDAYYVTPYFPRTAARLAADRTPPDADTLYVIVIGILEGLLELRRTQGRPHGNLKATNVLIRGKGAVAPADIVLTDPALEADATIGGEVEDLYNLGEIIHLLATGAKFPGQHTWPAPAGARWNALGKRGEEWRALCNHLLSPRAAEKWLRVDDILDEVAMLRPPRRPWRSKKLWTAVAALLLLAGGATAEYFRYVGQWRELCAAYANWLGPLDDRLAKNPPIAVEKDLYLKERLVLALAEARNKGIELDPRAIAGSDQPLVMVSQRAPLSVSAVWRTERAWRVMRGVEKSLSPAHWQALGEVSTKRAEYEKKKWANLAAYAGELERGATARDSAEWVSGIERLVEGQVKLARLEAAREAARAWLVRLKAREESAATIREKLAAFETGLRLPVESDSLVASAAGVDSLAKMLEDADRNTARFDPLVPALADAARRQRAYEVRGWSGAAAYLGGLLDRAKPGGEMTGLGDELAAARRNWEQVEAQWSQIEQRRRTLETSGDRILSTYRQFIAAGRLADQPDLRSLLKVLDQINEDPAWAAVARKVSGPEWARFDVIAFSEKSDIHRGFGSKRVASTADLRNWLMEADGFGAQMATATVKPETVKTVPSTRETVVTTVPTTQSTVAVTPTTKPATRETVAIATTRPAPTTVATTVKPPTTVATAVTRPAIEPEVVKREKEIASFITECREVAINAATPAIKQAWRARNTEIADALAKNHALYTPELKAAREKMRGRLLQLDNVYKSTAAPLELKPNGAAWSQALVAALSKESGPRWEQTLSELLSLAVKGDDRFEDALGGLVDLDEQRRASAGRLVADAAKLEALLAAGYVGSDTELAGALAAVSKSEFYKSESVRQALDGVLSPLVNVEKETDLPVLRQMASSSQQPAGVRLMAWNKLGVDASRATLEEDLKIGGELLAAVQSSVKEPARSDAIKQKIENDLRARWSYLMENAAKPQDVEFAIATRQKVRAEIDKLAPRARFNFALHEFRNQVAAAKTAREIEPHAVNMKAALAALEAGDQKDAQVAALAGEIARIGQGAPVDFAALGPMSPEARRISGDKLKWSVAADEDGARVTYRALPDTSTGREEITLVFRRASSSSASNPSWVQTSEVSLGTFDALLDATGKWQQARTGKWLLEYDPTKGDPRKGPRVWEWPRFGRIPGAVKSIYWLSNSFMTGDHYPDTIGSEFNRSVIRDPSGERSEELNPSRRQPMQQVTPIAALNVAALAGCRLPTIAEWIAAYKSVEGHANANLRDRTWRLQFDHMARLPEGRRVRPDAGMFVPAGEAVSDSVWQAAGAELNDGILWFRESASTNGAFADLAGNVAELVSGDEQKLYVIGASALSPPTRPLDKPFELPRDQAGAAFSDVGFRLAFSPPPAGIDKLKEIALGNWYLLTRN